MVAANFLGSRLTLLYGPSGVGKTSLLRAGVAAELATRWRRRGARRRPVVVVYPLRHHSWADPPLAGLMAAIAEQLGEEAGEPVRPWDGSRPAVDTLREWTGDGRRILLVLDQFEEYLRYHPAEEGEGSLAGELPRIVADPDLPVNVLIAIREDALARLDRFKATMPGLFDHYLRVDHLDEAAAREAIVKPLAAWGQMGGAGPTGIEDEEPLVRAVLDDDELSARAPRDRQGPPGSSSTAVRRIETPYLQLVMSRLWEAERDLGSPVLRVNTLTQRLGGPATIVNEHLAAAMRRLEREQGREATRLAGAAFGNLVTESGSKFALTAGELANAIREPEAEGAIAAALDVLCRPENRILRKVESAAGPDAARYELSHDVLGRAVQGWAAEEERRRLARARFRARRRAMVFAGLAAFMAVLLVVSLVAYAQLRDEKAATRSRQLASEAEATVDRDPVASLTGALAALDHPTPEAERALRLVEPEQRLRREATLPKGVSDVSSDQRANLLLTAGASGLTLFERRSPRDPRPLTKAATYSASVSADGRLGVSGGDRRRQALGPRGLPSVGDGLPVLGPAVPAPGSQPGPGGAGAGRRRGRRAAGTVRGGHEHQLSPRRLPLPLARQRVRPAGPGVRRLVRDPAPVPAGVGQPGSGRRAGKHRVLVRREHAGGGRRGRPGAALATDGPHLAGGGARRARRDARVAFRGEPGLLTRRRARRGHVEERRHLRRRPLPAPARVVPGRRSLSAPDVGAGDRLRGGWHPGGDRRRRRRRACVGSGRARCAAGPARQPGRGLRAALRARRARSSR